MSAAPEKHERSVESAPHARMRPAELLFVGAIGLLVLVSVRQPAATAPPSTTGRCARLVKHAAAKRVVELARARRAAMPRAQRAVCVFDFDDTLVDTSSIVGRYKGMALFAGIPHMLELFTALQQAPATTMVILTARPAGAEMLVLQNCKRIGLRMRSTDLVVTCPAAQKAAWRSAYCAAHRASCLVLAGDLDTDVNGPAGAIALRVHPRETHDVVCDDCAPRFVDAGASGGTVAASATI